MNHMPPWTRFIHPFLRQKQAANRAKVAWETETSSKNREIIEWEGAPRPWQPPRPVVVTTVRPWYPLAGCPGFCPVRCVLSWLHDPRVACPWAICFGLFGLVCFISSLGLTSNHKILIKLGPKLTNLQENTARPKPSVIGEILDKMQINAN